MNLLWVKCWQKKLQFSNCYHGLQIEDSRKSSAIENSYYSMLIKKNYDLIKVNGEVSCAIKPVVKAKNAGLGEKIPL